MNALEMLSSILSFIGGFLSAVFAEPLRRWLYRPVLRLQFGTTDHFITRTPEDNETSRHESYYLRVRAMNTRAALAKNCRAYLVNVEYLGSSGAWEATTYCESMQLAWAGPGDAPYAALDLPKDVPQFINVLCTREDSPRFTPSIVPGMLLFRYDSFLSSPGTYRFTVIVSGDGVRPASIGLRLKWTGKWDQFEAGEVDPAS